MTRNQRTLASSVSIKGFGFWSGRDVCLQLRPAKVNSGIVFVRSDLETQTRIPAVVGNRLESPRRTTLSCGGAQVEMVEHVMAALAGLQIDNCEIWVDAPELPGVDGSARPFVKALNDAGTVIQDAPRAILSISEITRVGNDEAWIEARPVTHGKLTIQYRLDFGSDSPVGREKLSCEVVPHAFQHELASARTFIMRHEAEFLRKQGLAQRVTPRDVLVFGEEGLIDNTLRFENECARHKVLDMIGDFALAGCDIVGQIIAYRSGHRLNAHLISALLAEGNTGDWRAASA